MIKLLIADDSALMRKLLGDIFAAEGDFEIRLARNGKEALDLAKSFQPDVVTLDVHMPEMNGLDCLNRIMIESPRPVVMVSALTDDGAQVTLQALDLGAIDFVTKPAGPVSLEIDAMRPALVETIRTAARAKLRKSLRLRDRVRHRMGQAKPAVRSMPIQPAPRRAREPSPAEAAPNERQRVIVITFDGLRAGFLVDGVSELIKIPASAIGPAPELSEEQVRLISRVANLEDQDRMILIVDAPQLLDRQELGLLRKIGRSEPEPAS